MENAVDQIIEAIQPNYVFDSHFVISQIIKYHSDVYIRFAGPNETTAQMHGRIAQIIQRSPFVRQLQQQSWSENIHGSPSECAFWLRIDNNTVKKKVSHTGKDAAQIVIKFCKQVVWFRTLHNIYKELFENEEAHALMEGTARSFFIDLNTILINYILLEFVKITDPATTRRHENFTIDNLIDSIDWPQDVQQKLRSLNDKTKTFKSRTTKARNKLLAHNDKDVFLTNEILGEFPKGEDETFLKTLEEICDITHLACFNAIFGSISVAMPGDVIDLKKTLKRALVFNKLLLESTGNEKAKLFSYLQEEIPIKAKPT